MVKKEQHAEAQCTDDDVQRTVYRKNVQTMKQYEENDVQIMNIVHREECTDNAQKIEWYTENVYRMRKKGVALWKAEVAGRKQIMDILPVWQQNMWFAAVFMCSEP